MFLRRKGASIFEAPLWHELPYFFFGAGFDGGLIVSTTEVFGRRSASFTVINFPEPASRPIFRAFVLMSIHP